MLDRRAFLGRLGGAAATMALPRRLIAFAGAEESAALRTPVRARGRVTGDIRYDGTPNGYDVYRAKGSELSWRHQATGEAPDHVTRVYAPGADLESPGSLIANVWGADGRWKIEWSEDGRPMGPMERRAGRDPLSVRLHAGNDLPEKHPWVDPVVTDHLFHAVPSASARRAAPR